MTVRQISNEMIAAAVAALRATIRPLATAEARLAKATAAEAAAAEAAEAEAAEAAEAAKAVAAAEKRWSKLVAVKAKAAAVKDLATAKATAKAADAAVKAAEARLAKATAKAADARDSVIAAERETRDARLTAVNNCLRLAKANKTAAAKFVNTLITLNSLTRDEQEQIINIAINILQRHVVFEAKCKLSYYAKGKGWCSDMAYCEVITTSTKRVVIKSATFDYCSNKTAGNRMRNIGLGVAASNARNEIKLLSSMYDICNMRLA